MTTRLCPESPRDLDLAPTTWWPGQRETIELIVKHFLDGKKYVMAGIPTGGGKTIIAAAVQRILAREGHGDWGGNSLALTHTIQLQQQYQRTLTEAKVITGRSNHLCELPADDDARIGYDALTAEDAPCNGGQCPIGLKGPGGCSYYKQWWAAARAPMVVMNYAFATRILQQPYFSTGEVDASGRTKTMPNPFRRTLLVADECHLTEKAIIDASAVRLYTATVTKAGLQFPSLHTRLQVQESPRKTAMYENMVVWKQWAIDSLPSVSHLVAGAMGSIASLLRSHEDSPSSISAKAISTARGAHKRLVALNDALDTLARIPDEKLPEWLVRRDLDATGKYVVYATVQPLWGWTGSHTALFNYFQKVLLMSATPGDPDVARVTLGIPKEEFEYIERPSVFPIANRPIYFWDCGKLNYQSSDAEWLRIAKAIAYISITEPYASRKGIVHSGSKKNAERIVALINGLVPGGRFFTHGSAKGSLTREQALEEFVKSTSPRVLVTASFTTGLDLPYIIGWQVIAKAPFGSLGDEITARRRAFKLPNGYPFGQQVYESECMNTVVQAAGRIVRSPDDSGPTFIIDGNYAQLHARAYKPRFYAEAYKRIQWEGGSPSS